MKTKLKLFLLLGIVGIVGVATPAMARPPRHTTVTVGVRTPVLHVGLDFGPRYERHHRYVNYQYQRGVALESQGQQLVAEGRDLEWRGQRWGNWFQVRQGERLQRRGYDLIRQGQALQSRSW